MNDVMCAVLMFIVVGLLYALLNFAELQDKFWKIGIIGGGVGFGFAGVGFIAPVVNPFPCLTACVSPVFMLGFVLYFYYRKQEGIEREGDILAAYEKAKNKLFLRLMGALAFVLTIAVIGAYTASQEEGITVQSSYRNAMVRIGDEVNKLASKFNGMEDKVDKLQQDIETMKNERRKDAKVIIDQTKKQSGNSNTKGKAGS